MLAALADSTSDDPMVQNEFLAIKETVLEMSKGKFSDLFKMTKDRFVIVIFGCRNLVETNMGCSGNSTAPYSHMSTKSFNRFLVRFNIL